jgi:DNA (cytosine-5)-methyltransferase 1
MQTIDLFGNQVSIFKEEKLNNSKVKSNSTKDRISRYVGLKDKLDNDKIFNGNWFEVDTLRVDISDSKFNFLDLFSGAGGMSVGFRDAGLNKLVSVEIDKDASTTIRNNFPQSYHFEKPIENLSFTEIDNALQGKKIHIVCGGPPCQGFSVAGLRNPNDPRNQLFKEYIRIVGYLQPSFIVMENVPGILTMQNGEVYREILKQLTEIGYPNASVRILEAASYGVPQLRTRTVIIANNLGLKNPYPKTILQKEHYKTIYESIDDLKNLPFDESFNHNGTTHSKEMEERLAKIPAGGSLYDNFRDAWKRQYKDAPSMTVKENHGGVHVHYELNRVLTAREMARLQTFPDTYIFSGTFKRAYWQIGNAVPCLLAKHIALAIKSQLFGFESFI